jgi:4-amino-4-deoxy-L-arabinose transferase-like glycosyltransferase
VNATKLWVLAILALIALNVWSVKWLPPVGMDDTLVSSIAHNFVQKGRSNSTMVRSIAGLDENDVMMGRLHLFGLAIMGFLFEPSIMSDRLWPLCMAVVSLLVLWQLAKSSLGPSWGMPAVALCMAEPMFFSYSHIPRPEMVMTGVFLLAIFCGMKALDKGKMWLFLAGLLGTLAIDVHLPGIILAPSIAIALILCRKKSLSIWPNIVWFIVGALVGLSWYLTWHILLNPQLYLLSLNFIMS